MMMLVFVIVVLAFIKSVVAHKTFRALPIAELRRRARGKDPQSAAIYRVAAYGSTFDLFIWLMGGASAAILILWTSRNSWWLGVIAMVMIAGIVFWLPRARPSGMTYRVASWAAPYYAKALSLLRPLLEPIAKLLPAGAWVPVHAGIYEKEDLLELLDSQNKFADNRIPADDLKIAVGALSFGSKKVGSIMTPRRSIRFVSETEAVGPKLMDELHSTGFSRFPVIAETNRAANPTITGTLYLRDLVNHPDKGKIKEIMRSDAFFINENCDLHDSLAAFDKTKHQLLVVVNNFEEITGVLSLEDVIEQILGQPIMDEFDKYEDLRAVANIEAERERAAHKEVEPAVDSATETESATE